MSNFDPNKFVASLNQKEYPQLGYVKIKENDKYGYPVWVFPEYDYSNYDEKDFSGKILENCKKQIKRTGQVCYKRNGELIKSESYYKQT